MLLCTELTPTHRTVFILVMVKNRLRELLWTLWHQKAVINGPSLFFFVLIGSEERVLQQDKV